MNLYFQLPNTQKIYIICSIEKQQLKTKIEVNTLFSLSV